MMATRATRSPSGGETLEKAMAYEPVHHNGDADPDNTPDTTG